MQVTHDSRKYNHQYMRYLKLLSIICFSFFQFRSGAQQPTVKVLESGKRVSIRGLSVVNNDIIWVSGSNGAVGRSTDGGVTWGWITVTGYEKRDFRDIEAFDENTAIIMGVSEPAVILKTKDGGKSWKKVFEDNTKGMFLDAMDFREESKAMPLGIVVGDPINNKLFYAFTIDGGDTWKKNDDTTQQALATGEAMFASSGTNVVFTHFTDETLPPVLLVTGGKRSNLRDISSSKKRILDSLPMMQGLESTGANSIAVHAFEKKAVIVGGNFSKDSIGSENCVLVSFGKKGIKMTTPKISPHGYRSCVIYLTKDNLVTCGTSGIDISKDGGRKWKLISKESFHVCRKAKNGDAVFLAGGNGRIARLVMP